MSFFVSPTAVDAINNTLAGQMRALGPGAPMRALGPGSVGQIGPPPVAGGMRALGPGSIGQIGPGSPAVQSLASDLSWPSSVPRPGGIPGGAGGVGEEALAGLRASASGGEATGLLARLGLGGGAAEATPLLPGGMGTVAALAPAVGGQIAGQQLHQRVKGTGGHILSGAARGAGIGGTLGLLGGPFAEISVPVGAGVGAGVGALGGFLFGNKKGTGSGGADITKALAVAGGSPDINREVMGYYRTLLALGVPKGDTKDREGAASQAGKLLLQRIQEARQQDTDTQTMLAAQAMAGKFMKPSQDLVLEGSNLRAQLYSQMADTLPKELQGFARMSAADDVSSAKRLAASYGTQAQLIGPMTMMGEQLQRQKQIEQQAFSQGLAGAGNQFDAAVQKAG